MPFKVTTDTESHPVDNSDSFSTHTWLELWSRKRKVLEYLFNVISPTWGCDSVTPRIIRSEILKRLKDISTIWGIWWKVEQQTWEVLGTTDTTRAIYPRRYIRRAQSSQWPNQNIIWSIFENSPRSADAVAAVFIHWNERSAAMWTNPKKGYSVALLSPW